MARQTRAQRDYDALHRRIDLVLARIDEYLDADRQYPLRCLTEIRRIVDGDRDKPERSGGKGGRR